MTLFTQENLPRVRLIAWTIERTRKNQKLRRPSFILSILHDVKAPVTGEEVALVHEVIASSLRDPHFLVKKRFPDIFEQLFDTVANRIRKQRSTPHLQNQYAEAVIRKAKRVAMKYPPKSTSVAPRRAPSLEESIDELIKNPLSNSPHVIRYLQNMKKLTGPTGSTPHQGSGAQARRPENRKLELLRGALEVREEYHQWSRRLTEKKTKELAEIEREAEKRKMKAGLLKPKENIREPDQKYFETMKKLKKDSKRIRKKGGGPPIPPSPERPQRSLYSGRRRYGRP